MNDALNGRIGLALLAVVAACAAGCSTSGFPGAGMGAGPARAVVAQRLTPYERDFAIRSAAKGMYEVEVSRLAVDRATDAGVRAYAQRLVREHGVVNGELIALLSARGIAPPKGLAADRATKLHRLASLPPSAAFDNGYVRVVGIEDHRTSIAALERARREVQDPELKAWIDRTLLATRNHLAQAQSLVGTLAG